MAVIRQLKNFFTNKIIYPKTLTKAVYDEGGERLDKILRDTMLATDNEEYNGVEPRDADTLGGRIKASDIDTIKRDVTELNSNLTNFQQKKLSSIYVPANSYVTKHLVNDFGITIPSGKNIQTATFIVQGEGNRYSNVVRNINNNIIICNMGSSGFTWNVYANCIIGNTDLLE